MEKNTIKSLIESEVGNDPSAQKRKDLAIAISMCVDEYSKSYKKTESNNGKIGRIIQCYSQNMIPYISDFNDIPFVVSFYENKGFVPIYINLDCNDDDGSVIKTFEDQSGLTSIDNEYGEHCEYLSELNECFDNRSDLSDKKFVLVIFIQDGMAIKQQNIVYLLDGIRVSVQSSIKHNIQFIFCSENYNKENDSLSLTEIFRQGLIISDPK